MMPEAKLPAMPMACAIARAGKPKHCRAGRRRAERAQHAGRMEPGAMDRLRRDHASAAGEFHADHDPLDDRSALEAAVLRERERRRNDRRARVDRAALESVVEVFAVCRRSR